jgi:hypothetical protein
LLARIDARDRDAVVAATLRADAGESAGDRAIWAVAGDAVVRVTLADGRAAIERRGSLGDLGPARSVRAIGVGGEARVAVGGRGGVVVFNPARTEEVVQFRSSEQTSRGFSGIAVAGDRLFASHGDLGFVAWSLADLPPRELHRWPATDAIDVVTLPPAGQILLAERRRTRLLRGEAIHDLIDFDIDLVALLRDGAAAIAVLADGRLMRLAADGPAHPLRVPAPGGGAVAAACGWDSPIGFRIARVTSDGWGVEAFGLKDSIVHRFASPREVVGPIVAAGGSIVAAASADRQRVLIWNAWDAANPAAEVNVAAATGHRVADMVVL